MSQKSFPFIVDEALIQYNFYDKTIMFKDEHGNEVSLPQASIRSFGMYQYPLSKEPSKTQTAEVDGTTVTINIVLSTKTTMTVVTLSTDNRDYIIKGTSPKVSLIPGWVYACQNFENLIGRADIQFNFMDHTNPYMYIPKDDK